MYSDPSSSLSRWSALHVKSLFHAPIGLMYLIEISLCSGSLYVYHCVCVIQTFLIIKWLYSDEGTTKTKHTHTSSLAMFTKR
jgi:hypothetical protein